MAFNDFALLERRTKMSNKSGRIDSTVVEDKYLRAIKYQRLKGFKPSAINESCARTTNSFRNHVSLCVF